MKQADVFLERIFAGTISYLRNSQRWREADSGNFLDLGNKFTVTTTNILLMMVAILLLVLILEGAEKPKNVRVVTTKREKDADKTN